MAARTIGDGARVELRSRTGSVTATVEACTDIMPGVVSLPHGYGHDRDGVRLHIASTVSGASLNDLTDANATDAVSGNAVLNGTPVEVTLINAAIEESTAQAAIA
jgi:anaerobic selenocysteine-containing dehydrogenase